MLHSVTKGKQKNPFKVQGYFQNREKIFLRIIKNRVKRGKGSKKSDHSKKPQAGHTNYLI
ncbi:hypothetical protein AYY16_12165 [Morganella psychrotolerans]|nr:hypothetical protein AYY16_12165 [Morganella psychrotolerans]